MSTGGKKADGSDVDLLAVARSHRDHILEFDDQLEDRHPVILVDVQRRKLRSYSFAEYKDFVRPSSHARLSEEYERAVARNKVFVVIWDSATRRLVTTRIKRG